MPRAYRVLKDIPTVGNALRDFDIRYYFLPPFNCSVFRTGYIKQHFPFIWRAMDCIEVWDGKGPDSVFFFSS